MHYIRFLKTPKVQIAGPASASLTALVTVTTDLGETFYSGDVLLRTDLLQRKKLPDIAMPTLLYSGKVSWKAGSRTVGINFNFNFGGPGDDEQGDLILRVSSDNPRPANDMTQKWQGSILSVRSAPIQLTSNGEPSGHYCERVLRLGLVTFLSIWEDTGESIARHVWYKFAAP